MSQNLRLFFVKIVNLILFQLLSVQELFDFTLIKLRQLRKLWVDLDRAQLQQLLNFGVIAYVSDLLKVFAQTCAAISYFRLAELREHILLALCLRLRTLLVGEIKTLQRCSWEKIWTEILFAVCEVMHDISLITCFRGIKVLRVMTVATVKNHLIIIVKLQAAIIILLR